MSNPFMNMSADERAKQKALLDQAMAVDETIPLIVAAATLKWSYKTLREAGAFGSSFPEVNQQAFPREMLLAKKAGLSETQVDALIGKAIDGLEKVKL